MAEPKKDTAKTTKKVANKKIKADFAEKQYRLADNRSGRKCLLKVGRNRNLLIFDSEQGHQRAIRHCPNEKSIFVDEQSDFAIVKPIVFDRGYFLAKPEAQMTQAFLDNHPDNIQNGGTWFETVDDEKEAKEAVKLDELMIDIKYAVRQKSKQKDGIHALKAVVSVIKGSVVQADAMGIEELKSEIYTKIEENPYYFTDDSENVTIFDDDYIYRKYLVLKSIKDGIIKKSANGRAIMWYREKTVITTAPVSVDVVDHFTDYLSSDEGMIVMEEIERRG